MAHDYKGRVIHVAPRLSQGGRWCTIVSITRGSIVHLPPVPADLMFDSAEEAGGRVPVRRAVDRHTRVSPARSPPRLRLCRLDSTRSHSPNGNSGGGRCGDRELDGHFARPHVIAPPVRPHHSTVREVTLDFHLVGRDRRPGLLRPPAALTSRRPRREVLVAFFLPMGAVPSGQVRWTFEMKRAQHGHDPCYT
jgi:hypothetical protein